MIDEVIAEHIRLFNEEEKDLKVTQPMPKGKDSLLSIENGWIK